MYFESASRFNDVYFLIGRFYAGPWRRGVKQGGRFINAVVKKGSS